MPTNQPCRPGETGRLVFTTLHNFLAPFVRYDILDDVTLAEGPCPCGRGLPLWTAVEGRQHPMFYLSDGRRRSSMGITLRIRQVGGCPPIPDHPTRGAHVIVRVVPDHTWTADHARRMQEVVQQELDSGIPVDIEQKESLERSPGGKLKIVVLERETA